MKPINLSECRPYAALQHMSKSFPKDIWQSLDFYRAEFGRTREIPAWCFAPRSVFLAAMRGGWNTQEPSERERSFLLWTQILGTWRTTQGTYRFDATVYEALLDMEPPAVIPVDVLFHLPEWCVYVETPGLTLADAGVDGFFATIEDDLEGTPPTLVLLIDRPGNPEVAKVSLLPGEPLQSCVERSVMFGYFFSFLDGEPLGNIGKRQAELLSPYLNLLLYIATQASEIDGSAAKPLKPTGSKTRKGQRFFPPPSPQRWDVGIRIGAALRLARKSTGEEDSELTGTTVRPHIRRAHWHGFWSGPRSGNRSFALKWLPPIAVKVDSLDALPVAVHRVDAG